MQKITVFLLCVFVFMLPSESMAYFPGMISGVKLIGILLVASAMLTFLSGYPFRKFTLPTTLRVAFVVLASVSVLWSFDSDATINNAPRLAQLLLFAVLLWEFAISFNDQMWIYRSFLVGLALLMGMGLTIFRNTAAMDMEALDRLGGIGQDANYVAYMCSVAVVLSVYMATNPTRLDGNLRWAYWGFTIWCAVEVLFTGSRGGFACLMVAGFFAAVLAGVSRARLLRIAQISCIALIGLIAAHYFVPQELISRSTFGGGGGTSIADDPRMNIWAKGLQALEQNPLLGVGSSAFSAVTTEGGKARAPHNTVIAVLVELGILGLMIYYWFVVCLFRAAWKLPRREKLLWIGLLVISIVEGMTCGAYSDKVTWFLYGMVLVQRAPQGQPSGKRQPRLLPPHLVPRSPGPLRPGLQGS